MPITLQEAKVGMASKVDQKVYELFQQSSLLLDLITFDDAVSPGTGGSTLTYGYLQTTTPATAGKRTINTEYTPQEAKKTKKTADCSIMGGSFEIDRVIINTSSAQGELAYQTERKVKATANEFSYLAINAVKSSDGFDGLKQLLVGTSGVITSEVDISTSALLNTNHNALLDELDTLISEVEGGANAILMNKYMLTKIRGAARRAGYYKKERDELGRLVEYYNDIPMIDLGTYFTDGQEKPIIALDTSTGKTDIYAVRVALDGFFGFSPSGKKLIDTYMPDLTAPGAVKKGEVELVAGVGLKSTRAAAKLEGIKIKAASS